MEYKYENEFTLDYEAVVQGLQDMIFTTDSKDIKEQLQDFLDSFKNRNEEEYDKCVETLTDANNDYQDEIREREHEYWSDQFRYGEV